MDLISFIANKVSTNKKRHIYLFSTEFSKKPDLTKIALVSQCLPPKNGIDWQTISIKTIEKPDKYSHLID